MYENSFVRMVREMYFALQGSTRGKEKVKTDGHQNDIMYALR